MGYKFALLIAVVVGFSALLLFRESQLPSSPKHSHHDGSFIELLGNLLRQGYVWKVPLIDRKVRNQPHQAGLAQGGALRILNTVRGGPPVDRCRAPWGDYADLLLKGLKKKIGTGHLRLVVLTHGHIDHVGGLPARKHAFPDAHVAFHTEESPYLTGQLLYKHVASDHDGYDLATHDVSAALPESRVLHLRGPSGDVADAVSLTGRSPKWLPPSGALQFHHMPGHAPGQAVYLHTPTGSLIAGDTFTNTGQPAALNLPPPRVTPNVMQARLSAKAAAALQNKRAFCTHDSADGVSSPELQRWAELL